MVRLNAKASSHSTHDITGVTVLKRWMYYVKDGNVKAVIRYLCKHLKKERCTGGKTKIICSMGKFRPILDSSEKVF